MPARRAAPATHGAAETIAAIARIEERTVAMSSRMDALDGRLERLTGAVEKIVSIEERQVAIKDILEDHIADETKEFKDSGVRLAAIEQKMPALMETRKWIVTGVIGIISMVGLTVYDAVFPRHAGHAPNPLSNLFSGTAAPAAINPPPTALQLPAAKE